MKPSEAQQILSKLYTDQVYRKAFMAGKEAFYQEQQISDPETIAYLNALKPEQLEFFAKGLYAKKYHEVMRQMPGTAHLLKNRMGELFRDFSKEPRSYGVHKHHEEALAFMDFIRREEPVSAGIRAVLKFEEVLVRNFINPTTWRICYLSYDAPAFLRSLHAGEKPMLQKKCLLIVFRKGKIVRMF